VGEQVRPVRGVAASAGARGGGGDGVLVAPGGGGAGEREHAEPGVVGDHVLVPRSIGCAGGVVECAGAGQAAGARAGGLDA